MGSQINFEARMPKKLICLVPSSKLLRQHEKKCIFEVSSDVRQVECPKIFLIEFPPT